VVSAFFAANGLTGTARNLTGDLTVEKVKKIVAEFPEVAGFGIGRNCRARFLQLPA
jgi:tryptophan synthase alpha subunit